MRQYVSTQAAEDLPMRGGLSVVAIAVSLALLCCNLTLGVPSVLANDVTQLQGHTDSVSSVAFSADGKRIASGGDDGTVRIWESRTGQLLLSLNDHPNFVTCVAFSPDGAQLLSADSSGTIKLRDPATGKEAWSLQAHDGKVTSVIFSPDGNRIFSGGTDNIVKVSDAATGSELATLTDHPDDITALACSTDNRWMASADSSGRIILRNGRTLETETVLGEASTQFLLTGSIRFFSSAAHTRSMAFSPDSNSLTTGSVSGFLWSWNFSKESGRVFGSHGAIDQQNGSINSIVYSSDGQRCYTAGDDSIIRAWCRGDSSWHETRRWSGTTGPVRSLALSPDGNRLASAGDNGEVRIWNNIRDSESIRLESNGAVICLSADGHSMAVAGNGGQVLNAETGKATATLDAGWYRKARRAAGLLGPGANHPHLSLVTAIAMSPDGKLLATGDGIGAIWIWDASEGRKKRILSGHSSSITGLEFSSDGRQLASSSTDHSARTWDLRSGRERIVFQGHVTPVADVCFSPDGKWLVSGGGWMDDDKANQGELKIWDARDGREIKSLLGHAGGVQGVAVSPDGGFIASAGMDGTVRLWDPDTGVQKRLLAEHSSPMSCICFSSDGTLLASGCHDSIVRIWDVRNGQQVNSIQRHTGVGNAHPPRSVTGLVFSADGKQVILCDGTIWKCRAVLP